MFPEHILAHINTHTLCGIRAGTEPRAFLNIWMVVVENRVFARSWGLSERSWYGAFLQQGVGAIQCGEKEVPVLGRIPADLEPLGEKINQAYLQKYTSEHNRPYAQGITQPDHMARTLELLPLPA
ncbi:DUF2255 family protein [Cesiribacter andamanensis]|uniref:DUF2255 domain-containing protein n=1 Tax=Cesiribacter andamanensis AMV16 TaxID=1279009 RepID=M7N0T2_9BACT|nr:DUF2255 family protein [Cesiribacter andamanensis]EMR02268.1 hypothetical protein ADICEAN_02616 [Cesiribacter andamanensis AMV16]